MSVQGMKRVIGRYYQSDSQRYVMCMHMQSMHYQCTLFWPYSHSGVTVVFLCGIVNAMK